MSSLTERQHASYIKHELARHLRDTLEQFGETLEAQAEECRAELAFALIDTGQRMTSSVPRLRHRFHEHAENLEEGAASATAQIGRSLGRAGRQLSRQGRAAKERQAPQAVAEQRQAPAVAEERQASQGVEATQHRTPGSHVAITQTMRGTGFVRPENDQEPESAIPAEGRDSHAA